MILAAMANTLTPPVAGEIGRDCSNLCESTALGRRISAMTDGEMAIMSALAIFLDPLTTHSTRQQAFKRLTADERLRVMGFAEACAEGL